MGAEPPRGHRLLPHTADLIVEAWGADDLACAEEAAQALIEVCVAGDPEPESGHWVSELSVPRLDLVRSVLEEVLFALDTSELAPVSAHLERIADSGVTLRLGLAQRDSVRLTGAAPKAIVMMPSARAGPEASWRCRFIVDV